MAAGSGEKTGEINKNHRMQCPKCKSTEKQIKAGFTEAGSQRYLCTQCTIRYSPKLKQHGYSDILRLQAVRMYVDGMGFRQIGRQLQVDYVSVMNWVKTYSSQLPEAPVPDETYTVEMDKLYTFIDNKKT